MFRAARLVLMKISFSLDVLKATYFMSKIKLELFLFPFTLTINTEKELKKYQSRIFIYFMEDGLPGRTQQLV
jgi:hypothetical protein